MYLLSLFIQTDPRECFDVSYEEFVNDLKNTSAVSGGIGFRQWTYQTCQQFGYCKQDFILQNLILNDKLSGCNDLIDR